MKHVLELIEEARSNGSEALNLSGQNLSTIPSEVFKLKQLKTLSLKSNQISTIPNEISSLINLTSLTLASNSIKVIPTGLFELENLETLSIKKNYIKILPSEFKKLKRLHSLSAINNEIETIEEGFCEMTSLRNLYLRKNKIKRLPEEFGKLLNLRALTLDDNPVEYPDKRIVKAGLMRIMLFFLINKENDNTAFTFNVPDEMKTAVKQYLIYFQEYIEKTKGKKIKFEVKSTDNGVQIETSKNNDLDELNSYFNEYLSFVKTNIDDLNPEFEIPINDTSKELVKLELRQQIVHLKQQIELKNFQIKFLESQVSEFYDLLKIQNSHPIPIYVNALSSSNSQAESTASADNDISIEIGLELPKIQKWIYELSKNEDLSVELKHEIQKIDDELLSIDIDENPENVDKKPFKRIKRIIDQLQNEESELNRVIKASQKIKTTLQNLGKSYNKIAQWLALPVVPDVLLDL